MPKYRSQTFTNVRDIDAFFQKLGSSGFVDWFNSNVGGRENWGGKRISGNDNLHRGLSSFMVEMIELTSILKRNNQL